MNRTPVVSSNVRAIGWEDDVLEVEFNNGGVYRYAGVPYSTYLELQTSDSVGSYLSRFVKPNYTATKFEPEPGIVDTLIDVGVTLAVEAFFNDNAGTDDFAGGGGDFGGAGASGDW